MTLSLRHAYTLITRSQRTVELCCISSQHCAVLSVLLFMLCPETFKTMRTGT
jgi:hypothetical protein